MSSFMSPPTNIHPRPLHFKEVGRQCLEADAPWDQITGEASYEVSPLIRDDGKPYAWQANYYIDERNFMSFNVDADCEEYPTKDAAIDACQEHNRERIISIIEEMCQ